MKIVNNSNSISRIMISLFVLFEHGDGQNQDAHREDSGQREAQQLAVAEMVGEGDGGYGGFELGCENTIILKNTSILTPYLYLFTYLRRNYHLFLLLNHVF